MKSFPPIFATFLLTACAFTPEDKTAAHQRELWKQAQANFLALKAQEHPNRPPAPPPEQQVAAERPTGMPERGRSTPAPQHHMFSFLLPQRQGTPPQPSNSPAAAPSNMRKARSQDDTVYYWQASAPPKGISTRDQIAEAKYARVLAKHPENLTPEERTWAHEHY